MRRDFRELLAPLFDAPGAEDTYEGVESLRRDGALAEAERSALALLEEAPYDPAHHDCLARVYADASDWQRAHDEWSTALHFDPHHEGALRGLAFVALRRGDYASALRYLTAARTVAPADEVVTRTCDEVRSLLDGRSRVDARDMVTEPHGMRAVVPEPLVAVDAPELDTALVVDSAGFVVRAARCATSEPQAVAGMLGSLSAETAAALAALGVGEWECILAECERGALALAPTFDQHIVIAGAERRVPVGRVRRALTKLTRDVELHWESL